MNFVLRIPDYYKEEIEALKGNVSINQFIVNALAEKIATLRTADYLAQRARKGSREHALSMLERASDIEPASEDRF